jgi:hypothetical protein
VLRLAAFACLAALLVTGCGVRNSKPFTADGTAPCLKDKGFKRVTTAFAKLPFIAGNAENGGLEATSTSKNVVIIAFAADADSVGSIQQAFRRFAPPAYKKHLSDVMRTERNAVMVWTVTPDPVELDVATRCLKP